MLYLTHKKKPCVRVHDFEAYSVQNGSQVTKR